MFKENMKYIASEHTPTHRLCYHYLPACGVTLVLTYDDESTVRLKQINKAVLEIYASK